MNENILSGQSVSSVSVKIGNQERTFRFDSPLIIFTHTEYRVEVEGSRVSVFETDLNSKETTVTHRQGVWV